MVSIVCVLHETITVQGMLSSEEVIFEENSIAVTELWSSTSNYLSIQLTQENVTQLLHAAVKTIIIASSAS